MKKYRILRLVECDTVRIDLEYSCLLLGTIDYSLNVCSDDFNTFEEAEKAIFRHITDNNTQGEFVIQAYYTTIG